ncbi:unnamed protein product [Adineta steineri]|uniref:Proteasome activator complex subunit 4-like HEAT repeat-like domain-containing protein n=1 Tax=Adineta steineri TaxID=433720 RepID=A0A815SQ66_9BILA|nr:unnamed protein product [Adineta steineri]CAF1513007.1 unnamed protein product [Adineta steineri]CAF4139612.1 unnamed protein product [Adineta steineri]CAF4163657.1 unnamed protein product [Adineta steineri]
MIIQSTNEISVNAAVNLWCPLETQEKEDNQVDIRSYTNLMETLVSSLKSDTMQCLFRDFGLAFVNNFLEQLCLLIREKAEEKLEGSHRLAAQIVTGMIRGSKYWTLEMGGI